MLNNNSRKITFPLLLRKANSVRKKLQFFVRKQILSQSHIIMYHRVASLKYDKQKLSVTPEIFRQHICYLKNNFEILSLHDLLQGLQKGHSKRTVAITFDDGFEDNLSIAAEILDQLNIPATFFISTAVVSTDCELWTSDLERIFYHAMDRTSRFHFKLDGHVCDTWNRDLAYQFTKDHFLGYRQDEREKARLQLCKQFGISIQGRTTHRLMSIQQIKYLSSNTLFNIGAHTLSHPKLSQLSEKQQWHEIHCSKKQIESWIDKKIRFFAYPFGQKADYNQTSVNLCKKAGFLGAVTAFPGPLDKWTSPYEMPRFNAVHGLPFKN